MATTDKKVIHFAGDINVETVQIISSTGVKYSVINQLIAIQLFEDLFSPFITGTLIFKDSLDFMNALPVIGQETLKIKLFTPSLEKRGGMIDMTFFIFKIKNRENVGDASVLYEIDFVSYEAVIDCNTKISASYSGKISDIAKNLLEKNFGSDKIKIVEETQNSTKYVSNYWSPVKNLNYLCERAINQNGSPSFIFFENRDGFNFGSLDTLYSSPTIAQKFNYNSFSREINPNGGDSRDLNQDYSRIQTFSVKESINSLERMRSGMIASFMVTSDIVTKQYKEKLFDAYSDFKKRNHLNKNANVNTNFPIYYTSKLFNEPKAFETQTSFLDITNTENLQQRVSQIVQSRDFSVNIVVPGRTDYTVGQKVYVEMYKREPIRKEESNKNILDEVFSGNYLITAINHYITRESHECNMELSKESYLTDFK